MTSSSNTSRSHSNSISAASLQATSSSSHSTRPRSSTTSKVAGRMSIGNKLKSMFGAHPQHPSPTSQPAPKQQQQQQQQQQHADSNISSPPLTPQQPAPVARSSSTRVSNSPNPVSPSSTAATIQHRASLLNKQSRTPQPSSTKASTPPPIPAATTRKPTANSSLTVPSELSSSSSPASTSPQVPLSSVSSSTSLASTAVTVADPSITVTTSASYTKQPAVLGSVTLCHATTCLLNQANWAIFPKSVAQQLKTSRFVVLDGLEDTTNMLNNASISTPNDQSSTTNLPASTTSTSHQPLDIHQLGPHLHSLRSARRLEKLGGMLREIMGNGKKVRDDAMSALPDLGLDPSQLNNALDIPNQPSNLDKDNNDSNSNSNDNNNTTPGQPKNGSAKRGNLSLMSSLIAQIERGERDVNSVVKGVSPASQMGSAVVLNGQGQPAADSHQQPQHQLLLKLQQQLSHQSSTPSLASNASNAPQSLLQKYGKCQEIVGKGTYGIVRVAHKYDKMSNRETLFAVKEFKRRTQESDSNFSKRLTSEYCISSSLHDNNIIHTLDLMKDGHGEYCQVMEYCDGGDLYSLILASEGGLKQAEADCFFKQLVRGVVYMHSMGVAHCDLKPENLLLTCNGSLKISDFGNSECFQMAWETEVHLSSGICGSKPYIAPEQFKDREFDPRAVDVWATGVIYMVMRTGSYLWQVASIDEDPLYEKYLLGRKQKNGFEPIEALRRARCRNVIYSILDPIPSRRITGKQILNSEWGRSIQICKAGERGY